MPARLRCTEPPDSTAARSGSCVVSSTDTSALRCGLTCVAPCAAKGQRGVSITDTPDLDIGGLVYVLKSVSNTDTRPVFTAPAG